MLTWVTVMEHVLNNELIIAAFIHSYWVFRQFVCTISARSCTWDLYLVASDLIIDQRKFWSRIVKNQEMAFDKIHACGNDFLLMDSPPSLAILADVCDRYHGIGADGVMTWHLEEGHVIMSHLDKDGSQTLCLNGTRAALFCLAEQGNIPIEGVVISEGQALPYHVSGMAGGLVRLELPHYPYRSLTWKKDDWSIFGFACNVGNPHYVLLDCLVPELFVDLAPIIRSDQSVFPRGTNVHLVSEEDDSWHISSYERGVEGFTKACGSGMFASALVTMGEEGSDTVVFQPDGKGQVTFWHEGDFIVMEGDAHWVASGVWRC